METYLKDISLPQSGFDVDSPLNFPKMPEGVQIARETIKAASKALTDSTTGPTERLRWLVWNVSNIVREQI